MNSERKRCGFSKFDMDTIVRQTSLPAGCEPMLLHSQKQPFQHADWIYEPKLDGMRCIAVVDAGHTQLFSRNRRNITDTFPAIAKALYTGTLSAVYSATTPSAYYTGEGPGYILTHRGNDGFVGLNVPQYGQPDIAITRFNYAEFFVTANANPFDGSGYTQILQTSDGYYHTQVSAQARKYYTGAPQNLGDWISDPSAMTPPFNEDSKTVVKSATVFYGNSVYSSLPFWLYGLYGQDTYIQSHPDGNMSFATTPDTKFNFEP